MVPFFESMIHSCAHMLAQLPARHAYLAIFVLNLALTIYFGPAFLSLQSQNTSNSQSRKRNVI